MATRSTTAGGMLLTLALTLTLTLTALQMQLASVEALPITSRPIEGNAQLLAWEEWQRLTPDQRTLEKEKKVTAKSIFTLPFRHCPPDHKRYGDRCIPQINIDPTDLIKQELLIELSPGGSAPSVNLDYDYSDSDGDEDSDELFINVPLMQKGQLLPPLQPNGAAEDQALPSEDAPLKFNIFENKYPMTLDSAAKSTATTATTTTVTTTETTTAATATATATTTAATVQQSSNRIAAQLDDLLADSSVALPSTTTLSISLPPSSSNIDDFGSIEAIVVPAGLPMNEKASIQLVTKADAPSTATSTTTAILNADAHEQQQQSNEKELQMNEERVQPNEDDGEEALAQLLKVDTLLPATAYGSSVDLLPPFSHRRVAPLLSADLDDADESAATDIAPTADATPTTATGTATAATTSATTATAKGELDAQGENRVVLKKSKVQPVQLSSTVATTTPTPTTATATTIATPTTKAESSSATTTTTTAAAEVEATVTATTTSDTAAMTTTTTVAAAADEGEVAAIHQDANGNAKDDDDRFYYQHSDSTTSSSTTTATATSSSTSNTVANADDLDELNYMAASDNLMTNTIGGQGDSEKAAGEMNFEQELSIINELVKGKWRLSQLRQQQQQQQEQQQQHLLNSSTTTAATTMSVESSEVTSSTPAATTATAATENTTFWSKLMPMLSQSSTEATTPATTDETAETIPATATTAQSSAADTSIATATTAATTTTAVAATTSHLSINTNRSNRNSKIIRIDSLVESSTTTTTTTTPAPTATPATPTVGSNSSTAAAYTPFWWLPNFGVRLDRQVDENGEDRSLLLRFFRPFRAGNTAEDATRITTLPSRR